jgi:hypothetical protein
VARHVTIGFVLNQRNNGIIFKPLVHASGD